MTTPVSNVLLTCATGGLLWALTAPATPAAAPATQAVVHAAPAFTAVQPELLGVPNSYSNAWGDYDNDGDLDLAVSLGTGEVRLYRNDAGVLVSVGAQVGMPQAGSHELRGLSWGDYDQDGDIDLLGGSTPTDKLTVVLRNDGGKKFVDVAAEIGLTIPKRSARQTNWVDYDNDGDLDIFAPNYGHNLLFRNNNNGTFTEVGQTLGVGVENHAVSADWGDYDNDGDLDLSVISYVGEPGAQTPLNAFFRNDGVKGFVNLLTKDSPLNVADHASQFVDYDNDGAIDLSVTDGYGPQGGHFVFRNALPADAKKRSLSVLVLDAKGHHTRFGAEVRLFDATGRILASRQVVTGGGYSSQRAAPVHFGLATLAPVRVEVTFMSKDGRKKQTLNGVNPADFHGKSLVIRQTN